MTSSLRRGRLGLPLVLAFLCVALLEVEAQAQEKAASVKEFTYKSTEQGDLKMFLHFPANWKQTDQRPAIVFFFGGGWTQGTVNQFTDQASYLATRGMVAARADYRVKSRHDVTPDKCVEDAKSAVRWLRKNAATLGIDPNRIVASGGSAGGHIAACTGTTPGPEAEGEDSSVSSKPNAMILFNPVLRLSQVPQLADRVGGNEELAKLISPTLHLRKDTPPTLFFYGTADRLLEQGKEFEAKSKELGHGGQLYTADAEGHGFFNRSPWKERTLYRADEFLGSLGFLEGKPTLTAP